jgi:hypothetical protein
MPWESRHVYALKSAPSDDDADQPVPFGATSEEAQTKPVLNGLAAPDTDSIVKST